MHIYRPGDNEVKTNRLKVTTQIPFIHTMAYYWILDAAVQAMEGTVQW